MNVGGDKVLCDTLINAAGLGAQKMALRISSELDGYRQRGKSTKHANELRHTVSASIALAETGEYRANDLVPPLFFAKAHYFSYSGKSPFQHRIYPLPEDGGLGIHATNDLSGAVRFGPDVTWVDEVDYAFDEARKSSFVSAIRQYYPAVDEDKLIPAFTGIRPKIVGPGEPAGDFVIHTEADHGVPNLVNLYGIESPGLTASLAIADYVKKLL
jgi:L-2-hydroxyglutarate oxidase LhgO